MKKTTIAIAFLLAVSAASADVGTTVRLKDRGNGVRRDVYLLIGQSNMAGRGILTQDSHILPVSGIMKFDADNRWVEATEPIHFDKAGAGAGLSASFAVEMKKTSGDREIGLVPCAVGGTSIVRWIPGGDLYSNAVARCRAALASGGTLKGILWHQGESDAYPTGIPYHAARLKVLVNGIRAELNMPGLPFVAGELTTAAEHSHEYDFDAISNIMRETFPTIPNCGFVSSSNLTAGVQMNSDGLHFNTASLREFGRRYAAKMLELQAAAE